MSHSRLAVPILVVALGAPFPRAAAAAPATIPSPVPNPGVDVDGERAPGPPPPGARALPSKPFPYDILEDNNPYSAGFFLSDGAVQAALKARDPELFGRVFARAAELKDLEGVFDGQSDRRSIREALATRYECSFCQDTRALPEWVRHYLNYLDKSKVASLESTLWDWDTLTPEQQKYLAGAGAQAAWPTMPFAERHIHMRHWAAVERETLLKINPSDADAIRAISAKAAVIDEILDANEMNGVWQRLQDAEQAMKSLVQARAKVGNDPRLKELLDEAQNAPDPASRLAALSKLFENMGERPRELLEAAPPRADQKFDPESRRLVGEILKSALLKETEGTFAGNDLKVFYARVPLTVAFSRTENAALGWYQKGTDTLNLNERYIEQYVKSRGAAVADLERDPALLRDLARTVVGTFVHEAQHHQQDVWAREQKLPSRYSQSDEVEAFQVQALFLLQKMKNDRSFRAFAEKEGEHSDVMKTGLSRARRMEEEGPDYFEWVVPNAHYPEVLSNEGNAWCQILWHNNVARDIQKELERRAALPDDARRALDAAGPMKATHNRQDFLDSLPSAGTAFLAGELAKNREAVEKEPEVYAKFRDRREAVSKLTTERYKMLESGRGGPRDPVPSPVRDQ